MEYEKILNKLEKYNATHLLHFYEELDNLKKAELLKDIDNLDLDYVKKIYETDVSKKQGDIKPVVSYKKENFTQDEIRAICNMGKNIITSNKYAIVTMAGGQGTRLGHTGPKGTYKLDLKNTSKYIFEIFVDRLKEAKLKYNVYIPWYIMTSRENNADTIKFFEANNYFGYPKEKIFFFKQEELPITDMEGNVLLETKSKILKAADGNGGVFNALAKNNITEEMRKNGVKWVLITGIDNILVNLVDEFYIGLTHMQGKLNGVKSIVKTDPNEKVGVFCKIDGLPSVIEYSEMTEAMLNEIKNGELVYSESNIVNHLINIDILEKIQNEKLPIHKAIKKLNYIDKDGKYVELDKPGLIKYEAFIFDYFNFVDDVTIYRVDRNREFAPIKNKEGVDSPVTAKKLYNDLYKEV